MEMPHIPGAEYVYAETRARIERMPDGYRRTRVWREACEMARPLGYEVHLPPTTVKIVANGATLTKIYGLDGDDDDDIEFECYWSTGSDEHGDFVEISMHESQTRRLLERHGYKVEELN